MITARLIYFLQYQQLNKMEQLCQILSHKMTLIASYHDLQTLSIAQKDSLLDQLLQEKKKESLGVLAESRFQQAVSTKHILASEEIKEITHKSHSIMTILQKHLQNRQKDDALDQLVSLYLGFFQDAGCSQRVKEIRNIHQKRLCPKSLIPSTLFNWLVEWTRKRFNQFLKISIHSLYIDSRKPIHLLHEQQKNINKSKEQNKGENKGSNPFLIVHRSSMVRNNHSPQPQTQTLDNKEKQAFLQQLRIGSPRNSSIKKLKTVIQPSQNAPINREVFLFAFSDELQKLYKTLQDCLPDLDMSWTRKLKKGGRREEIERRIEEVAGSFIRQMAHIKLSINSYYQHFRQKQGKTSLKSHRTQPFQEDDLQLDIRKRKRSRSNQFHALTPKSFLKSKNSLDNLQEAQNPPEEGYQHRSISTTDRPVNSRRQQLLASLSCHRYGAADESQHSQSNLLPSVRKQKKHQLSLQIRHNTIDLSLDSPKEEYKILWLNSPVPSSELSIIEQKVKKLKLKVMQGRPLREKASRKNRKRGRQISKSIESRTGASIQCKSLPVANHQGKNEFKLPRLDKKQ